MTRSIAIHGTDEVMSMWGSPGIFFRGKWENVQITSTSEDENVPLEVRTALIGLTIPTIFTKESIEKQTGVNYGIPEGSRLAYCTDVIRALGTAGHHKEAEQLQGISGDIADMYVIDRSSYKLLQGVTHP